MLPPGSVVPIFPGQHVIVVFLLQLKAGHEELVLEEFSSVLELSRKEAGCVLFDLYRLADDPARLFVHEVWESRDAFEAHASTLHTSRFRAAVNSYLERPIERFEVLDID
jgi:quinol monooxygenase YgiN